MVLLKFLGSYGNAVALQKIGHMMGLLKGSVNDCVVQACNAIWSIMSKLSSGQTKKSVKTSVEESKRYMVSLIALVWLLVHCFLWLLHPWWMERIIIQEKVIMLLKVWSFVVMMWGSPGSKWNVQVVYTTIDYGQTVRYMWVEISMLIRRSICLGIQHFQPQQWWLQPWKNYWIQNIFLLPV